jgi:hypothetical protein
MSRHLNQSQIHAIVKVGDCLCPGDGALPAFGKTNCVAQVDRILDYMPQADLGDLKMLLSILAVFPRFFLGLMFRMLEASPALPGPIGAVLRQIRIGMRGLIMSLYYGDPAVLKTLQYEVGVFTKDIA